MEEFSFGGTQNNLGWCNKGCESFEGGSIGEKNSIFGTEEWGEGEGIDSLSSDYGFYQNESLEDDVNSLFSRYQHHKEEEKSFSDYGLLDEVRLDVASPPIEACVDEIAKPGGNIDVAKCKKEKSQYPFSLSSLELLNNYGSGFKRLNSERRIEPSCSRTETTPAVCKNTAERSLSTEDVMRVAGEMFIQSSCEGVDGFPILSHPFDLYFSGLSGEEIKDVQLASFLLAAAEKVGDQLYERASRLLDMCDQTSSKIGNPVQRVVCHFSDGLREKINRETGRSASSKGLEKEQHFNVDEAMVGVNPLMVACHGGIPFGQVMQFSGIQAIVENVAEAKRVHIIDFGIKIGVQWTALMEALASRKEVPLELLKVTAIGTTGKHLLEDIGKRLKGFAESMDLPFSFNLVMVSDMLELRDDLFELDAEETVAVYFENFLRSLLATPNRLENLMRVIRNINPCVTVVIEVEANHNSPIFVNRFIEALFYFSAFFDCLETCMKREDPYRMIAESVYFREGIRSMVAAEGEERKTRHVKIDVWRAFFARYGMEEAELSSASLYQATLVLKNFAASGRFCTIDMDGKCMIVGWKGTPIHSVSVWKFLP